MSRALASNAQTSYAPAPGSNFPKSFMRGNTADAPWYWIVFFSSRAFLQSAKVLHFTLPLVLDANARFILTGLSDRAFVVVGGEDRVDAGGGELLEERALRTRRRSCGRGALDPGDDPRVVRID